MSSSGVNRPTNVQLKEKDVNQKLQLYGIYSAFSNGKVPSNKQIDVALNSALASKPLTSPSKKLSEEGQHLVADLREVIEQAKFLLLTKNEGNLLQDFIWQTQKINGGGAQVPSADLDRDTAQQHGNQALDGLRTLGTLIISNGQFRKLLSDATILARDMAGDAAQKAANKVNPNQEQLNQIDRPAEDNTWHEVPDFSKQNIKNQIKNQYDTQKPFSQQDAQNALGDATQAAHPAGTRDPAQAADLAAQDQQYGTSSGLDAEAGARAGAQNLKDRASENVPQETKDRQAKAVHRTKNYLSDKMPQERREQTIWRLKKMIVEIQGHRDYQQAIETLLDLAETYTGHAKDLTQQGVGTGKAAHKDSALQAAEADLRTLLERFANSTSADDLFDAINNIYRDSDRDPELKNWFKQVDSYIRKCLQEQGFVLEDAANEEWNRLYDRGNFLLRERYRDHFDHLLDEFKFLGDQFEADPQNKEFGLAVKKLFTDLGNDENGKPVFKKHLVKDLSSVIIPAIFENVRYVPIPRIEYSDPTMDAVIENLVIESDNLMPNVLEFGSDNYFRWGRKKISNKKSNKVMLSVSGVQMDLRDVSYYIKKKQGFPSLTDIGVADIFLGGQGLSFKVKLATAEKSDNQHFFKIEKVDVDVKHLNVKLKQSKHKLLFNVFKPLLFRVIRPALQKVLEKQIKDSVNQLDGLAYEIHQEAKAAERAAKEDPENAPNIYSRYAEAAQKKVMQGKKKTESIVSERKVNVAVTQKDSIFQDIKLPGGISTKATEYKELAAKGEKWESPVFSIGSASESSNLPKVERISRKPHQTATGGIRGPQNSGQTNSNFAGQNGTGTGSGGYSDPAFGNQNFLKMEVNGGPNAADRNNTFFGRENPVYAGSS
ncbi:hypothetical protein L228DRAFT_235659 [Xylona heveae TC161]|uniref:Bactericidal permeability-increasing protein n=1 Tax=Xylona heveae (strain CBS 132557 / TC161) TaxID=1328760 RepID=A0A165JTM8_XYLHT|nr:hypothetical protein L228DRAFT_235659 [Xylona heveae TC161]KZF26612.1 hypothetical protein L228DRAFT_235659 [Xylona heveae TC161]